MRVQSCRIRLPVERVAVQRVRRNHGRRSALRPSVLRSRHSASMKVSESYPAFNWRDLAPWPVIGIDEAGRGSLAGPVYAAAVILISDEGLDEFRDSKRLTALQRERLAALLLERHRVGVGRASAKEIDRYNIHLASILAMRRAVRDLGVETGHLIVDGRHRITKLSAFRQTTLVKGDDRAAPISAASIIAKWTRDGYMVQLARRFPGYSFEEHKGYATAAHREALQSRGVCREHRARFTRDL